MRCTSDFSLLSACVLMLYQIKAFKIEFFEFPQYEGFLFQKNVTEKCLNLNQEFNDEVGSVRTSVCLMIYNEMDCQGLHMQILSYNTYDLLTAQRLMMLVPDPIKTSYNYQAEFNFKSYHACTLDVGGGKLNVDLTEYSKDTTETAPAIVLERYTGVCSCHNIPRYLIDKDMWSINNFGNSLVAYFEQDCSTSIVDGVFIPGGKTTYSIGLGSFEISDTSNGVVHKVKSFGPDPDSDYYKTHCVHLYATVLKFEILETPKSRQVEQNVEMMASKTVFWNNGPGKITQKYSVSESIRESFQFEFGKSLSNLETVQLDNSFDIDIRRGSSNIESNSFSKTENVDGSLSFGWSIFGLGSSSTWSISKSISDEVSNSTSIFKENGFRKVLRHAYENSRTGEKSAENITTVENVRTLKVEQTITVPPCTENVVVAYVKQVQTIQTEYQALLSINGKLGNRQMTAVEISDNLDSRMIYVEDRDPFTVLVYQRGTFLARYGLRSDVISEGSTIHDCVAANGLSGCPACQTCDSN